MILSSWEQNGKFGGISLSILAATALLASSLTASAETYPMLELLTEDNPPLSMHDPATGQFSGINVQIIRELMDRAEVRYQLKSLPINRAYREAVETPNSCIIGLIFTEERKDTFSWVKPTATGGWALYKKPGSAISLASLADARAYSVAAAPGYPSTESLEQFGGIEVVKVSFAQALKLLHLGRVDLALSGLRSVKPTALVEGVPIPELALVLRRVEAGLACNPHVDKNLIRHLNAVVATMEPYINMVLEEASKPKQAR